MRCRARGPHRGFPVLRGGLHEKSQCDKLVCPYHRWTFDLKGEVVGAPYMHRMVDKDGLRAETRLREFKVEVIQGFIFVNFDMDAAPLKPALEGRHDLFHTSGGGDEKPN